jgi:hypothetical protein
MPHFWMTYRDSGRLVGVVIMEAPSLIQAGLKAIRGVGAGATFAEGPTNSAPTRRRWCQRPKLAACSRQMKRNGCSPSSRPANQASSGLAGLKNDAAPLPAAMDRHRERRIVLSARRCAVNFARLPELRKSKR